MGEDSPGHTFMGADAPDSLKEFFAYHGRMFMIMAGACIAACAALVILRPSDPALAGGFAVGALARLAKFRFLDIIVVKKIAIGKKDAATTQLKVMVVWVGMFIVAAAVVFLCRLNVWGLVAGLFLPPAILIADTYLRPNLFRRAEDSGE